MSEWIKCGERMPQRDRCVLVWNDETNEVRVAIYWSMWTDYFSDEDIEPTNAVTHWMPLPKPPEARND